jgi:hypothetical protein
MYELKTNTAVRIAVGPLVDPTDGKTAETSLTVTGMTVDILQMDNDGTAVNRTSFSPTASGGNNDMIHITDDAVGMYDLELTAAQLNYLGNMRLVFYDVDGFLVHWIDLQVVSAAYFDWKYGTTIPNVNVTQISGDGTAADNAELFFDGTGYAGGTTKLDVNVVTIANNAITAASINADAITNAKIADNAIAAENLAADCITAAKIADNAFANEHFADGALTSTEITSAGGCIVASIANNAITAASMNADASAEIADAVWDEAISGHLGAGTTGNALNAAGSAGDPWSTPLPGSYGAGTAGLLLGTTIPNAIDAVDNYIDTEIGTLTTELAKVPKSDGSASWNATALAAIQGECTDALNAYDPPTNAEMEARTLPSADYTVVSDLGTVQTGDSYAIVNGDHGLVSIQDDIDTLLTRLVGTILAGNHTAQTGDVYARLGAPVGASISADITTVDAVVDLIKKILANKLVVTESNGNAVLYDDDNTTPLLSNSITSADGSTTRTRMT